MGNNMGPLKCMIAGYDLFKPFPPPPFSPRRHPAGILTSHTESATGDQADSFSLRSKFNLQPR